MSHRPTPDAEDGYRQLVCAVMARAAADAQGETFAPGIEDPGQLQAEARSWLAAEAGPRDLVELCGTDADVVMQRLRRVLEKPLPVTTQPQLTLF